MATTRRIRSSSSKRRIRLLPRKPAEPVTATTPVLAPTEASSRERPIPGERSRGPAFRPECVRLRPLLGRSEADHLTTMLSWRSDDDLQHPGALAPGALRAAPADRNGRYGGGLPRAPRRAARLPKDRGGQTHLTAVRERPRFRRHVCRRGGRGCPALPPQYRPGVRLPGTKRRALQGHGISRPEDRRAP